MGCLGPFSRHQPQPGRQKGDKHDEGDGAVIALMIDPHGIRSPRTGASTPTLALVRIPRALIAGVPQLRR